MADRIILEAGGVLLYEEGIATDALAQEDGASFFWEDGWRALLESVVDNVGTVTVTLADDTLVAVGTLAQITGTVAATTDEDNLNAVGTSVGRIGTLAVTLADDTLVAVGSAGAPVTGTVAVTLDDDSSAGSFGPGSAPPGRRARALTGYGLGYTLRKQPLSQSLN